MPTVFILKYKTYHKALARNILLFLRLLPVNNEHCGKGMWRFQVKTRTIQKDPVPCGCVLVENYQAMTETRPAVVYQQVVWVQKTCSESRLSHWWKCLFSWNLRAASPQSQWIDPIYLLNRVHSKPHTNQGWKRLFVLLIIKLNSDQQYDLPVATSKL